MSKVWLNGALLDENAATVPVRDAGLLYAAGVFTTMRSYAGRVFRLADHLKRLRESCEALFVPLQYSDETMVDAVGALLEANDARDARLRMTVTRGAARQDPLHGLHLEPHVFLTAAPVEPYPAEYYENGMTVIVLDEQKLNPYDVQAGHKTLNYFSRLSSLKAASTRGAGEALWFDVHHYLQSSSVANVFLVEEGKLVTPPTPADLRDAKVGEAVPYSRSAVLPGITRAVVLTLAEREGISMERGAITIDRLLEADEVFLTNSVMQVMPVCRIERREVGSGKPGEVTRRLSSRYDELTREGSRRGMPE